MARKKSAKKTSRSPAPRKKSATKGAAGELRPAKSGLPTGYDELLDDLKSRVRSAQLKAAVAVNRELIQLYWDIGRLIVERQEQEGWGKSVVERLADDIQQAFPGLGGFSRSNVFRMRAFYSAYAAPAGNLSQPVTESRTKVARVVRQPASRKVAQ